MNILFVGLGGLFGAIARYQVGLLAQSWASNGFPLGTFTVNVIGSFLIGVAWFAFDSAEVLSDTGRLLLIVGFLGSFTTFSAFSNDTFILLQNGQMGAVFINVIGQVALGMIAVWLGLQVAGKIWG